MKSKILQVASATTLRVLNGGLTKLWQKASDIQTYLCQKAEQRAEEDTQRQRTLMISLEVEKRLKSTAPIDLTERVTWSSKVLGLTCNSKRVTHHRPMPKEVSNPLLYHRQVLYICLAYDFELLLQFSVYLLRLPQSITSVICVGSRSIVEKLETNM